MQRLKHVITFAAVVFLAAIPSFAKPDQAGGDLVQATLLADVDAAAPGGAFTLGVRLKMKPHWHTYWINPGDFGNATRISPTGPAGFQFGEVHWPLPSKIDKDGSTTFGYEGEVLLQIPVKVAKGTAITGTATIAVDVTWLSCSEACVEGGAKLTLPLPISAKASPANGELFDAWRQRVPISLVEAMQAGIVAKVVPVIGPDGKAMPAFSVEWKITPAKVQWYPVATRAVGIDDVSVKTTGQVTEIFFKPTIYKPEQIAGGKIDSVFVYEDGQGQRRGVSVPVEVSK